MIETTIEEPMAISAQGSAAGNVRASQKDDSLTPELLGKMNAYWRAANYLSVGQIYLYEIILCSKSG